MAKNEEKVVGLHALVEEMNKNLGAGTMISFEDGSQDVKVVGSGSIALDMALGGGYPLGRIVEIYGPESSGKTTLSIEAIREVQHLGKAALFLDLENAFDPAYAKALGVSFDKDKWIFSQPDCGEDAFTILDKFVSHPDIGIIVVDSIAAMTPRAEMEGEFGESKMGLHARMMSQGCRKLVGKIKKSNTLVIFINQIRDKIGVMFGNPETTPGGNAMKFYASQRLRVGKAQGNKDKAGEFTTNIVTVKITKNKIAVPHRKAVFHIRYGEGIDTFMETLELAVELGIVKKGGSWYSYGEVKLGQGADAVRDILADNPELYEEIYNKVVDEINAE